MDWRADPKVRDIGDQFMFGPALLVNPVLQADATRRSVYLPDSPGWYDFWTGTSQPGGHEIDADAPLERIPLYVRAGSILPWARKSSTQTKSLPVLSNCGFIREQTESLSCIKMRVIATTMNAEPTPSFHLNGRSQLEL